VGDKFIEDVENMKNTVNEPTLESRIESLEAENQMLKDELCEKDNTYSWCRGVGEFE